MRSLADTLGLRRVANSRQSAARVWRPGDAGPLFDPSVICSLFQDAAGTIPVTAPGQPVGLMLDQRYGARIPAHPGIHAAQPVSAKRPTYHSEAVGGRTYHGLSFDGVDDHLVTPAIAWGTDEVTVVAGVTKRSDAALGVVAELGIYGAAGTWSLGAPGSAGATYRFGSQGAVAVAALSAAAYPVPRSDVMGGHGKIADDAVLLRINGAPVASNAADQGSGGYSTAPLYIGMRGGTSLPFSGILWFLASIGRGVSASDLRILERAAAAPTPGVTLAA